MKNRTSIITVVILLLFLSSWVFNHVNAWVAIFIAIATVFIAFKLLTKK